MNDDALPWASTVFSASAFLRDGERASVDALRSQWAALFGGAPEETQEAEAASGGEASCWVTGRVGLDNTIIQAHRGRLDLFRRFPMTGVPDLIFMIDFEEHWPKFTAVAQRWFPTVGPMKRMAMGAQLLRPFDTDEHLVAALKEMVPVHFRRDVADFMYQVNRWSPYPRVTQPSAEPFCINRIARWNVVGLTLPSADLSPKPTLACTLALDLNTDARRAEQLPTDEVPALVEVLSSSAVRIARAGDREEEAPR